MQRILLVLLPALARAGYRADAKQEYTAEEVNASALQWTLDAVASTDQARAKAQQDCAQHDSHVVRANADQKSFLKSGAWCLPEGDDTSRLIELPNSQSYKLPKIHAPADAVLLPFLDRLLRGCSVESALRHDDKCSGPPRRSIIDFGAGVGQYGHSLRAIDPAHRYRGYDGAGNVDRVTSGFVTWADLTNPRLAIPKADWLMSLEVGEHINSTMEQHFVRNLHTHNCRGLVLSWGALGQWGRGHINNHGTPYLVGVFSKLGYVFDAAATGALRNQHNGRAQVPQKAPGVAGPYRWFEKSLHIFRRAQPQRGVGCSHRDQEAASGRKAMAR